MTLPFDESIDDELPDGEEISKHILDAIAAQKERPTASDKLNYSRFREDSKQPWTDIAGEGSLAERVGRLVSSSILLPRQGFQLPIAAAYLMQPSALMNKTPILASLGGSGSGKSTLGFIACAIHGVPPISAGSTFASIRNTISSVRVWDVSCSLEHPGNEKNAALVWEDISPSDLLANDGNIFALLKNGCERAGTITIAGEMGVNKTFKVFCPKFISSIHPIHARFEFRELVRRMIVIQHKPLSKWVKEDYDDYNSGTDPLELVDLNDLDWDGLKREFREFWEDPGILQLWVDTNRSLRSIRNHGMTNGLYSMSRDLICTGVVTGLWSTTREAIDHMAAYWEWHVGSIESQASATTKALAHFVESRTKADVERNKQALEAGKHSWVVPLEIPAKELKDHIDYLKAQGELDTQASTNDINNAMASLGWMLKPNAKRQNTWQPANG